MAKAAAKKRATHRPGELKAASEALSAVDRELIAKGLELAAKQVRGSERAALEPGGHAIDLDVRIVGDVTATQPGKPGTAISVTASDLGIAMAAGMTNAERAEAIEKGLRALARAARDQGRAKETLKATRDELDSEIKKRAERHKLTRETPGSAPRVSGKPSVRITGRAGTNTVEAEVAA